MKEAFEIQEKKQAAADVLDQYSKFVMVCIGNQVQPCDLRLHLMKEISGLPTSLKSARSFQPPEAAYAESFRQPSSSGASRHGKEKVWY